MAAVFGIMRGAEVGGEFMRALDQAGRYALPSALSIGLRLWCALRAASVALSVGSGSYHHFTVTEHHRRAAAIIAQIYRAKVSAYRIGWIPM